MPRRYNVKSTYEFLQLLRTCDEPSNIASLDVESLFTNVPVTRTIEIILQNVYHHESLPPPKIDRETLRALLTVCTTKTPFKHINGELYVQIDGVSMGSPLGPTFAEYYMCELENRVFAEKP